VNNRLARFSVQQKIFALLIFGFVGFVIYVSANYLITKQNRTLMQALLEQHLPKLERVENLSISISQVKVAVAQNAFSTNMESISALETANTKALNAFSTLKEKADDLLLKELTEAEAKYKQAYSLTSDTLQNVLAGLDTLAAVQAKLQTQVADLVKLETWATELKTSESLKFRASVDSATIGSERSMYAGLVLILGGFPFVLVFYWILRDVIERLKQFSRRLSVVAQNVLNISNEASGSSNRLASSSSEQAAAVMESVSSMEEMKNMLGQTVKHSAEALRASEESFRQANDGRSVIAELRSAMADIEQAYDELQEVNEIVGLIRSKTNIINDIVFKTQLLSFNASIEAARAGQHGRGFSVVAAEVGKLAETSGLAAQEIGKLLDHSTKKVAQIVDSTKDKVGSAKQMSQKCASVFERITDGAGQVKSMVDSITGAASEQEAGILQVGRAMMEMKDAADQTDQMAQRISELSDILRGHSSSLASTVEDLESLVNGARGGEKSNLSHTQDGGASGPTTYIVDDLFTKRPDSENHRRSA